MVDVKYECKGVLAPSEIVSGDATNDDADRLAALEAENADLKQRLKNWNCGANSCAAYKLEAEVAEKDKRIAELEAKCKEERDAWADCNNMCIEIGKRNAELEAEAERLSLLYSTLLLRNTRLRDGQQAAIDGYIEPIAHMYPSDLKRFETKETYATAYSVAVGNPNESSRPLYSEATVQALQAKVRELEALQNSALLQPYSKAQVEIERLKAENAELRADAERWKKEATDRDERLHELQLRWHGRC